MRKKKIYNPTILHLHEIEDPEVRSNLEDKFIHLQGTREIMAEKSRKAARLTLEAQQEQLKAQIAQLEFIEIAAEHLELVRSEPMWLVYRKNGEIVLENPFSERDARNMLRLNGAKMNHEVRSLDDIGDDEMYEHGDED